MALGRIFRPVVDADRCQSCCVCTRGCPAEVLPELRNETDTVRGDVYRADAGRPDGEGAPPCEAACPLGQRVREYVTDLARGRWREALLAIRRDNPLPSVCGHLCHHPCQAHCLRGRVDEAVAIRELKRLAAAHERDHAAEITEALRDRRRPGNGRRVAVVGSGPAGLTAAHDLALAGCAVTVVEAAPLLGGALRLAIPAFRLPRDVLERELALLAGLGWTVETGRAVASPADLDALRAAGHEAILLACGAARGLGLAVPGWEAPGSASPGSETDGCLEALGFLRRFNAGAVPRFEGPVLVVGGGNVALDAARVALRCGAGEVRIVYRRDREQMPVDPVELREAEAEGVGFRFHAVPAAVEREAGAVVGLRCLETEPGPPDAAGRPAVLVSDRELRLAARAVIAAVGQTPDHPFLPAAARHDDGRVRVEPDHRVRGQTDLFAAGDGVAGPGYVVEAMASGRAAARSILGFLEVAGVPDEP